MELSEFVQATLSQIVEGVKKAQADVGKHGAHINPDLLSGPSALTSVGLLHTAHGSAQLISFDVALTSVEGSDRKAGVGVVAAVVSLGAGGEKHIENSQVSRVQFVVPLVLPATSTPQ